MNIYQFCGAIVAVYIIMIGITEPIISNSKIAKEITDESETFSLLMGILWPIWYIFYFLIYIPNIITKYIIKTIFK